jgi:hypothetical protein
MPRSISRYRLLLIALAVTAGLICWLAYLLRPYATHPAADTSWTDGGRKANVTVSIVDKDGQPLPAGVTVTVWTRDSEITDTTNASGFIDHPAGGEMMALDLNGVRVVQRASTGPLGALFGPNIGWGLSVKVMVKDRAALGIP